MHVFVGLFLAAAVVSAQVVGMRKSTFENRPAVTLSNDKIELTILTGGGAFADLVLRDDPARLSPLWNPARMMRELGTTRSQTGPGTGHFLCVDGFGPVSAEERAAGLPMHGEAHAVPWEIAGTDSSGGIAVTFKARLPIVQELLTRVVRLAPGENVVYVDTELENLMGFDRPVNWAEHGTIGAPFLAPGVTAVDLSGTRSTTRPHPSRPGALPRRLASGREFIWPMAPSVEGPAVNLRTPPETTNSVDHTATLIDPAVKYGWITAVNPKMRLLVGYLFRREEFPWVQSWESYPPTGKLARGLEFSTQPFDVPRREAISAGTLFGTPLFRWLPAKSKIASRFLFFYTRTPEGMRAVDRVAIENGRITIEDRASGRRLTLAASQPL